MKTFEAQSPGLEAGCLRFVGWVAPPPRKTRFQVLVRLSWAGLVTRRVSTKGFEAFLHLIPLSQACLAQSPFRFPVLPQAVRLGHRAERPHPPDPAKGRRERHVP